MEEGKLERGWAKERERALLEKSSLLVPDPTVSPAQLSLMDPPSCRETQRDPSVPKSLPKQWSALNLNRRQLPYCEHDGIMPILSHIPEIQAWLLFCAPAWLLIRDVEMRYLKYRGWHVWGETSTALRSARFESEADASLSGPVWLPCRESKG